MRRPRSYYRRTHRVVIAKIEVAVEVNHATDLLKSARATKLPRRATQLLPARRRRKREGQQAAIRTDPNLIPKFAPLCGSAPLLFRGGGHANRSGGGTPTCHVDADGSRLRARGSVHRSKSSTRQHLHEPVQRLLALEKGRYGYARVLFSGRGNHPHRRPALNGGRRGIPALRRWALSARPA